MVVMEITGDAQKKIAFTKPYIRMPSAFMTLKPGVYPGNTSLVVLDGKAIGVELVAPMQAYLEDVYKRSEIHPYRRSRKPSSISAKGGSTPSSADKDAIAEYMKTRKEAQCCVLSADGAARSGLFRRWDRHRALREQDKALKAMFEKALDFCVAGRRICQD